MPLRIELANAIRALSMDAVQKANSGHPGAPMGMADIAEVLWNDYLSHNPQNPQWANRDRFVLSNGHGSMLIYALLHLTGYNLTIDDIKNFRQLHAKTAGHPEYGYAPGVETTTGPLGQGITNAVGMALAEQILARQFNRPGYEIVNHYTYVFLGDGCLMEGISHEACSLAGTLKLNKLICFYDDNGISIDGHVDGWFTDDTPARFRAYGWQVIPQVDGHNPEAIHAAIESARASTDKPTLICCKTIIGKGAPNLAGSHDCHGAPLGAAEIAATRQNIGWQHEPFVIPSEIYNAWDAKAKGAAAEQAWNQQFAAYAAAYPEQAVEYTRRMAGQLPANWAKEADSFIQSVAAAGKEIATRKASQNALEGFAKLLPELFGGSADLTGSNLTNWSGSKSVVLAGGDNYLSYGVREFGMSAMMNGMRLHGGFLPYGGTFLVFSDYARNAIRMAALMKINSIFVYTHDSIGLGEDGPTHQPIEHVSSIRLIPNMHVWRPCDAVESAVAWKAAIERTNGPSSLVFTRQNLKHQPRDHATLANIQRGGYILIDCTGTPDAIIIATGSEVGIAAEATRQLTAQGHQIRLVSMPCVEVFKAQEAAYQAAVLPPTVTARVAVEAGVTAFWYQFVGLHGKIIGIDRFGESAPAGELFKLFGFTADNVVKNTLSILNKQ